MYEYKSVFKIIMVSLFFSATSVSAKKMKADDLTIEPTRLEIKLDQEHEFTVHGGKGPYTFKTSSGMVRYRDNTATYISPNNPGEATITVKDSTGVTKTVKITVLPDTQVETAE